MHRILLAAAVLAASLPLSLANAARSVGTAIPNAKSTVGAFPPSVGQRALSGFGDGFDGCASRGRLGGDRFGHSRRDRQGFCDGAAFDQFTWYGGSTYDDRAWAPESGNGWWHDRPDRAFPRWVQHNQNCTPDRMWWSGSGWHC